MENHDEVELWRSGIVVDSSHIPLSLDGDVWDDTEILEVFNAAIREHKTKTSQKKNKGNDKHKDRNSRNVHFAEGAVVAPNDSSADTESVILGQWTEDPASGVMGKPHVNFDLATSQTDSNTHTDNEGSDSGAGSHEYHDSNDFNQSVLLPHTTPVQPPTYRPPMHPQLSPSQDPSSRMCHPHSIPPTPVPVGPLGSMPPAPSSCGRHTPAEGTIESALSDMLMAWYQSGYTTGRYYAMLENQQQQWQQYYHQQANAQSAPQQQQQSTSEHSPK